MLDLGIVIVNWTTRDLLRECLRSVAASQGDFAYRVIVVDNASSDGSADMVRAEFPDVTLIASAENEGYPRANNHGLRALGFARGCAVRTRRATLWRSTDTVLPPGALGMLAYGRRRDDWRRRAEAGAARWLARPGLPPQLSDAGIASTVWWGCRLFPRSRRFGRYNLTYLDPDVETEVNSVVGAFMLVRRAAIQQVGCSTNVLYVWRRPGLGVQIKQAGWKVMYNPRVTVTHVKRAASRQSRRAQREFYRAMLLFYRKHYRQTTPWWLHSLILLGLALKGGRPLWRELRHPSAFG